MEEKGYAVKEGSIQDATFITSDPQVLLLFGRVPTPFLVIHNPDNGFIYAATIGYVRLSM
jgi:hypothetical protein